MEKRLAIACQRIREFGEFDNVPYTGIISRDEFLAMTNSERADILRKNGVDVDAIREWYNRPCPSFELDGQPDYEDWCADHWSTLAEYEWAVLAEWSAPYAEVIL